MSESDRVFLCGRANPRKYGMSLRVSCGTAPGPEAIAGAATLLGRAPFYVDEYGFECEVIAATVHSDCKRIVYVESRAKEKVSFVDIAIKIHYVDSQGKNSSVDIESYNPFFGCDVGFLEWFNDDVALLIYTEKHWTFAYCVGDCWPPHFVKIEARWQIRDNVLSFMGYKAGVVTRLRLPDLEPMPDLTIAEAEVEEAIPRDSYED